MRNHTIYYLIVIGIVSFFDGIRYLDVSPQNSGYGYDIYLDQSYLAISHDMRYDITIYRDISCYITPDYPETAGNHNFNETPRPFCQEPTIHNNTPSCSQENSVGAQHNFQKVPAHAAFTFR